MKFCSLMSANAAKPKYINLKPSNLKNALAIILSYQNISHIQNLSAMLGIKSHNRVRNIEIQQHITKRAVGQQLLKLNGYGQNMLLGKMIADGLKH